MTDAAQTPAPVPAKQTRDAQINALTQEFIKEGLVPAPGAPEQAAQPKNTEPRVEATTTEVPAKVEAPAPSPIEKSFERLAQERQAFRQEQERVKPYIEALRALSPEALQTLVKAKMNNDPLAAISALGYSYADIANKFVDTTQKLGDNTKKVGEMEGQKDPQIAALEQKIAKFEALQQKLEMQEQQQQRQGAFTVFKEKLPADKYALINAANMQEHVFNEVLKLYSSGNPDIRPEDVDVYTAEIAGRIEKGLENHYEMLSKAKSSLTQKSNASTVPSEPPGQVRPGSGKAGSSTITNNVTAPAATKPEPKSRNEIINAFINDPNFDLGIG